MFPTAAVAAQLRPRNIGRKEAQNAQKSEIWFGAWVGQCECHSWMCEIFGLEVAQRERSGVYLGKALSCGFDGGVELEEYRRMAAVEDEMWFYRALHAHLERELIRALGVDGVAHQRVSTIGAEVLSGTGFESGKMGRSPRNVSPRTILDAGCGTGGLIRRLEKGKAEWRWTGVDVEPLACELARTRCAAEIVQGSLLSLPFPESTFDAVVCSDVLYHLDDDVAALREIFRVLRPGGVVAVNVPAHRWLWSYHDEVTHARRRYGRREAIEKLGAAGFAAVRATHWNALPLPLVIVRRKLMPAPRGGSDVRRYAAPAEWLLSAAMRVERGWLRCGGWLPFGSSILAVGSKPPEYGR
jgi:SAM-dependent methyltransferase